MVAPNWRINPDSLRLPVMLFVMHQVGNHLLKRRESFFTGLEFTAKPINLGAKLPIGTFQTIHIAAERINLMQPSVGFICLPFNVL